MGDPLVQQPVKTLSNTDLSAVIYDPTGVNALAPTASGHLISDQGVAAALSGAWPVEITDGTNVLGTAGHPLFVQGTVTASNPSVGLTGATAPTSATEIGGVFNTALPTYTNGQLGQFQIDANGRILVGSIASALPAGGNTIGAVTQASGPWTMNLTQVGGSAIALGQTTMSASLPVAIASNQSAIPVSGTVTANQGTAAALAGAWPVEMTDGTNVLGTAAHPVRIDPTGTTTQPVSTVADNTPGSAVSVKGFIVGGSDGTNFRYLKTAADGTLYVNDQTSPGTPVTSTQLTSASLAAGASVTLSSADITTGKTGYLKTAVASSAAPIKAVLNTVAASTPTAKSTKFDSASNPTIEWWYQNDEIQQAGGTNNHWSITITNQDNNKAADVYANFSWVEL